MRLPREISKGEREHQWDVVTSCLEVALTREMRVRDDLSKSLGAGNFSGKSSPTLTEINCLIFYSNT